MYEYVLGLIDQRTWTIVWFYRSIKLIQTAGCNIINEMSQTHSSAINMQFIISRIDFDIFIDACLIARVESALTFQSIIKY